MRLQRIRVPCQGSTLFFCQGGTCYVSLLHFTTIRAARSTCQSCFSFLSVVHASPIRLHVPCVSSARTTLLGSHALRVGIARATCQGCIYSNICQGFTRYMSWLLVPRSPMHHVSGSYTCQGCTYLVSWLLLPHFTVLPSTYHVPRALNIGISHLIFANNVPCGPKFFF